MIVKIAVADKGEYLNATSYVLYDGISRAHLGKYETYKYDVGKRQFEGMIPDLCGDFESHLTIPMAVEYNIKNTDRIYANELVIDYATLFCTMKDGSVKALVFDTMAYIMNDEGKTVEKITVNM